MVDSALILLFNDETLSFFMGESFNNSRVLVKDDGNARLDSWKEIASYLGKSVRTVQRWEEQEGLPVHRLPHSDRSSVFAFPQELDAWRAGRSQLPEVHADESGTNGGPNRLASPSVSPSIPDHSSSQRRRWVWAGWIGLIVLGAAFLVKILTLSTPTVQILNYTQLTHDGQRKEALAADRTWAYFLEEGDRGMELCKVPVRGGEITHTPIDLPMASTIALSPDGSRILIAERRSFNPEANLWIFSNSGKPLRQLKGGVNIPFAWAPGDKILYAQGANLWTSDEDGTHQSKIFDAPDAVSHVGWSSDGKRIWYSTHRAGEASMSIGEIDADGGHPRPLYEENGSSSDFCCGFWSASGASFGFISSSLLRTELLVTPESTGWFHRTRAVSRAPLGLPEVSGYAPGAGENRFLLLAAAPWHGDLFRYDHVAGQFVPYFEGISAREIDYSPDGQSAAYVDGFDGSLWRLDLTTRQKTRLTNPPFLAHLPHWSPDGQWIALTGSGPEGGWKIYRLPSQGGTLERLIPGDEDEGAPTWSPDGKSLAFGKVNCGTTGKCGVYQFDLRTHSLRMLPGSQGLRTARWSPDGKYVAALQFTDQSLMLFDFSTQQWKRIAGPIDGDDLSWSHNSKYVYGFRQWGDGPAVYRVSISGGLVEQVANLKELRSLGNRPFTWFGLAPDDSPVVARESSENELYSVSCQMP